MDGSNPEAGDHRQRMTEIPQRTLDDLINLLSSSSNKKDVQGYDDIIGVHQRALDDLVNVNSLFTIAVFIGLSVAAPHEQSLEGRPECNPDSSMGKKLIQYEILSFALFLLSSLGAKSLKVLINLGKIKKEIKRIPILEGFFKTILLSDVWRRFLLALSIAASFVGILFLTLSMVFVIQIKIGKLSCGSNCALNSVTALCGIVVISLLLYAPSMLFAVIATAPKS